MAKGDVYGFDDEKFINLLPAEPDVITFNCQKAIIKPNEVITEWPDGFPIEFDKYQRLVFTDGKTRVTYSKLRVEKV